MLFVFISIILLKLIDASIYIKVDYTNKTEVEIFNKYVKAVCKQRSHICKVNNTILICSARKDNGTMIYKEFEDGCELFMYNFCDHPGQEYYIVESGKCETYLNSRRNEEPTTDEWNTEETTPDQPTTELNAYNMTDIDGNEIEYDDNSTDVDGNETESTTTENIVLVRNYKKLVLRKRTTTKSKFLPRNYKVKETFRDHPCPYSCPNIYNPICILANKGMGVYFKFKVFINSCEADLYYCKHPEEFAPPPDEEEDIRSSELRLSFCADARYLQFARFSESVSSMGHFGWLAGDQNYRHIMEPYERRPGYG